MTNLIYKYSIAIIVIFAYLFSTAIHACTTVFSNLPNQAKIVARSMDLSIADNPIIVISPKNIQRDGKAGPNSIHWKAKYGSVAVSEFHTDAISDGMNEAGLATHLLYLHQTVYEKRVTTIPGLANGYWARYLLDNFKSVNEVIKAIKTYQIVSMPIAGNEWPLHLAIEDSTGDSAIIEFIAGKMTIYHGPQYKVMTNEPPYKVQLENLHHYKLFGGNLSLPGDVDPLSRFVRASSFLKTSPAAPDYQQNISNLISIMRTVMVPYGAVDTSFKSSSDVWPTRWLSLSNLSNKIYYFRPTTSPNIMWIDLNKINFSANQSIVLIDPNSPKLTGAFTNTLTKVPPDSPN